MAKPNPNQKPKPNPPNQQTPPAQLPLTVNYNNYYFGGEAQQQGGQPPQQPYQQPPSAQPPAAPPPQQPQQRNNGGSGLGWITLAILVLGVIIGLAIWYDNCQTPMSNEVNINITSTPATSEPPPPPQPQCGCNPCPCPEPEPNCQTIVSLGNPVPWQVCYCRNQSVSISGRVTNTRQCGDPAVDFYLFINGGWSYIGDIQTDDSGYFTWSYQQASILSLGTYTVKAMSKYECCDWGEATVTFQVINCPQAPQWTPTCGCSVCPCPIYTPPCPCPPTCVCPTPVPPPPPPSPEPCETCNDPVVPPPPPTPTTPTPSPTPPTTGPGGDAP